MRGGKCQHETEAASSGTWEGSVEAEEKLRHFY